jgi:hypothetical protein
MTTYQNNDRSSEMNDATSRFQWKRPSRGGGAESAASIPPAPMASVARFAALKAKIYAYNRSHAGGDSSWQRCGSVILSETEGGIN